MSKRVSVKPMLCSKLAIATVMLAGATPAMAQSFLGNATPTGATVNQSVPGVTTIDVTSPQAVINWEATGPSANGLTTFQAAGTTATFQGMSNFAVLNRVTPAAGNAIFMNGTINSLVNGQTGGTVYFYSPTGIVIGGSARINVGSLGLTTSPIASDEGGNWMSGFGSVQSSVAFGNAAVGSYVRTDPGSQINALSQSSYVALVSPRVTHGGTINVNGSAALVGAEAATLTFRTNGLFDIQVTAGTADANGVVNNGTVTGPASSGAGDHHRAYLVAVPKNQALTMLIQSGNLGFDIAGAANVIGNAVVLSAGYDLNNDNFVQNQSTTSSGTIFGTGGNYTSTVRGSATGNAALASFSGSRFASNIDLFGIQRVQLVALRSTLNVIGNVTLSTNSSAQSTTTAGITQIFTSQGGVLNIGGSLTASASASGLGGPSFSATGGRVELQATSGTINIAGNASLFSQGIGSVAAWTGTGGTILANADQGRLTVGGLLRANADGIGGTGGVGTGGFVDIIAGANSTLSAGSLNASADGFGGADAGTGSGAGFGGTAQLRASGPGSSISIAGIASGNLINQRDLVSAEGFGGVNNGGGSGIGGMGQGGTATVSAAGGGSIALPTNALETIRIIGRGTGGNATAEGTTGGAGIGGTAQISIDNATLTAGPVLLSSFGNGGRSVGTGNISGGAGSGGVRSLSAVNGAMVSIGLPGGVAGGSGGDSTGTGIGGNASGGTASLLVDNSTVNFTSRTIVLTQNSGGDGAVRGNASGGNTTVTVRNGGIVNVTDDPSSTQDLFIGSNSFGGNAVGGNVTVSLDSGTINGGDIFVGALAYGGGGSLALGGEGRGGNVNVNLSNGTITAASLELNVTGFGGGIDVDGTGGAGFGGTAVLNSLAGSNTLTLGDLTIDASGNGGSLFATERSVANGGTGGSARGGSATLTSAAGTTTTINAPVLIIADAKGGDSFGAAGIAGSAVGGLANVFSIGNITFNGDVSLEADALGGEGILGADGGDATGGRTRFNADGGVLTVNGDLTLSAVSDGGDGRNGGDAIAIVGNNPPVTPQTDARVLARNGSVTVTGITSLDVSAEGGTGDAGGTGGAARAGYATIHAQNGNLAPSQITLGPVTVNGIAFGGEGGAGISGASGGAGGNGGAATGGFLAISAAAGNGNIDIGDLSLFANAFGGAGGTGGSGDGGPSGNGGNGGAATGGFVLTGTESGVATEAAGLGNGSADFGTILADASAFGGDGGDVQFGSTGGLVGNGGAATGGNARLIVRGSTVTIDDAQFYVNASGGNGGFNALDERDGVGGNATAGSLVLNPSNRFQNVGLRGTLDAGSIVMAGVAIGGDGAVVGKSWAGGRNAIVVANSDVNIGEFSLLSVGVDGPEPGAEHDDVAISNSVVTVAGSFDIVNPATMSVWTENATLNAGSVSINAGNFIRDPLRPAPTALGTIDAGSITLTSGQDIIVDANLVTRSNLSLSAPGLIAVGNLTASATEGSSNITLDARGTITAGNVTADGTVAAQAVGNLALGGVNATSIALRSSAGSVTAGALTSTAGATTIDAFTNISVGNVLSVGGFFARAGGDILTGDLSISGDTELEAGDDIMLGAITADLIDFTTIGDIVIGNVTAAQSIDLEAGGTLTAGNLTAGDGIYLSALGALTAGHLSAGLINRSTQAGAEYDVGVVSGSSVALGNVAALGAVGIGSAGSLTAGSINSGSDVLLAAGGNVQTNAITTGANNRLVIAGFEAVEVGNGGDGDEGDFDRSLVFTAIDEGSLDAAGGSIVIGGAIGTFQLDILARNDVTLGAVSLVDQGRVEAGGLLTLNGNINNYVSLTSNDIAIAAGARIDEAELVSRNPQGTFIGDGLAGSDGYRLSNSEFNQFGSVEVGADLALGAGSTMTIGDLTVSNAGSEEYEFGLFNGDDDGEGVGTIRIVGDVKFSGMPVTTEDAESGWVYFSSNQFLLDAATGSLTLEGAPGVLAGGIEIEAQHVAIAEGAILDKLTANPAYAELAADLARPTVTSVPGGVIRASVIEVDLGMAEGAQPPTTGPAYSIYVQNTGTKATPAGFTANEVTVEIGDGQPVAPIALIANGQVVTQSGTLTGADARDALVEEDDPARFTADSTINGCSLTGSCRTAVVDPFVQVVPDLASQISLINTPLIIEQQFGNEDAIADNEDEGGEDSASSPISPPAPLFNTKPLEQSGDTDEPVSGGGNPALTGDDDDDECGADEDCDANDKEDQ